MVYEIEILLTGLFFILFLIIISIFGFLLIYLIYKDIINLNFSKIILISLGSGIVFFIFYAYIIETFIFFNFFTIILPLIIFDLFGFFYFLKLDIKLKKKLNFQKIRQKLIKNKFEIIIYLFFFIIVFFLQFQAQIAIIVKYKSQLASDPYFWFRNIMYLIDFGHLEYKEIGAYPSGYVFVNASMILFHPNVRFAYFFLKFVPIFYMSIIIFIGFLVSKILFNQKFLIFLTMFGFLTLSYFNYRFLMPLPSSLATILFFIFSTIFIDHKIPFYLKGILLAGPILSHPLLGIICLGAFFMYIIVHFFNLKIIMRENKKTILKFFRENIYIFLIFSGLLIPFLINLTLKFKIDWYLSYWHYFFPATISTPKFPFISNLYKISLINFPLLFIGNFSIQNVYGYLELVVRNTFVDNPLIFFLLIYFFVRIKKKNYKNSENFIEIIKIIIVFGFCYNFIYYFIVWFFPYSTFGTLTTLFYLYKGRIFEFFAPFIILMLIFTIHDIYILFNKFTIKLKEKYPNYRRFLNRNYPNSRKEKVFRQVKSKCKIETFFIIFILFFAYSIYQKNKIYYEYTHRDNNDIEMILAVAECEPNNLDLIIIIPELDVKAVLNMLYRYNYFIIDYNQTYTSYINQINTLNASYIVLPIAQISEDILDKFISNYDIYYQNIKYIVIKII